MWVKEICRLAVQGGFLDGLEVCFQSGLNCIVGPRGTGKSSILNLIRFAVGDWTAQPRDFIRQVGEILDDGQVELDIITEFDNFRCIRRKIGRYPRLYDNEGKLIQEGSEVSFGLEAYRQGELEQLLEQSGTALMDLVDRTIDGLDNLLREEEANRNKRLQVQRDYEAVASRLLELQKKLERKNILVKELEGWHLNEPEKRKHALIKERSLIDFWERQLSTRLRGLRALLSNDYHTCCLEESDIFNIDLADELINRVNDTLAMRQQLSQQLEAAMEHGLDSVREISIRMAGRHQEQEEQIARELQQHGFTGYEEAERRRQTLMAELAALTGCEDEHQCIAEQAWRLLEKKQVLILEALRLKERITRARRSKINRLNAILAGNPFIRFNPAAYLEEYRHFLQEKLHGNVSRRLIDKLARRIEPHTLMSIVLKADFEILNHTLECGIREARQIIWLLGQRIDSGQMTEIPLRDQASLFYRGEGGVEEVCSYRLSRGTQCSLLLPIILLARQPVLMGDQFEDNLDNACIYEMVIPRLKSIKGNRQVILVTHNPNIVVSGQADWVVAMTMDQGKGRLRWQGKLEEEAVRREIMATLEGGREAFCQRVEYLGVI